MYLRITTQEEDILKHTNVMCDLCTYDQLVDHCVT
jgi:hypothetical protein